MQKSGGFIVTRVRLVHGRGIGFYFDHRSVERGGQKRRWEKSGKEGKLGYRFGGMLTLPSGVSKALMKIVGLAADEVFVLEGFDVMGLDGDDIVDVLEPSCDEKERFLGDDEAEFLEELRRHDGI